jgi:indolepyruvate ferredoxin oxidoreductase beta subunit
MKPAATVNIVFAGVGGQGVLTASEALGRAAMHAGHEVKKSEVHGMAQRGGSVESQVRFGGFVNSPLIPSGSADFLVAFERLEALRFAHRLKDGGIVIINTLDIPPMDAPEAGPALYLEGMEAAFSALHARVIAVPGQELAASIGDGRAAGTILLGVLSGLVTVEPSCWDRAFGDVFRPGTLGANLEAFRLGRSWADAAR